MLSPVTEEHKNTRDIKLLLVEDNDDHAELVVRTLGGLVGPESIYRLSDGEQVLGLINAGINNESAAPNFEDFDLVLLDLRLPKIDGLSVLGMIKHQQQLSHVPVVILTTSEAEIDMARAHELSADAYRVKPLDFTGFQSLMHELGIFRTSHAGMSL